MDRIIKEGWRNIREFPIILFVLFLILSMIGVFTILSASISSETGEAGSIFIKHIFYLCIGFSVLLIALIFDYRLIIRFSIPVYIVTIILLILTLIVGKKVGNARRWLDLGIISFQPSEFAKLTLCLVFSWYYHGKKFSPTYSLKDLIIPGVATLIPAGLIFIQPDLGTSLILIFLLFFVAFMMRLSVKSIAILILIFFVSAPISYKYALSNYQRKRIINFIFPERESKSSGYHLIQARYSIGSGRIFGKGFKKGSQARLRFLPEKHTDFIFALYSEERGFIGNIILLSLYLSIMLFGIKVALSAMDTRGKVLAISVTGLLFLHTSINLCGVSGLIPLTGIALPFLSYGGTSLIMNCAGVGLLMNVWMRRFSFE